MKSKFMLAGVAALATAGVLSMTATSALADPPSGTFRTYQAVGSDTIQDVWNGLTNGTPPVIADVASYDAFGACITTRSGGTSWVRPAGSGDGVKFLSAAYDTGSTATWNVCGGGTAKPTSADVAFARSSSGPSGTTNDLTYIPFGRDAVSVAYKTSAVGSIGFSLSELQELYTGVNNAANGSHVAIVSGVPQVDGAAVAPQLPQAGSGTRKFFQAAINVPDTSLASYVNALSSISENHGDQLSAGDIIPFSAAQWIAQKNLVSTDTTSGVILASIGGSAPTATSGSILIPGALFGHTDANGKYDVVPTKGGAVGEFFRDTYNVIPTADIDSEDDTVLTLVDKLTGTATGDVNGTAAQAVLAQYGFGKLSYAGSTTLTGAFQH